MGKVAKVHYEKLISEIPDRYANRVKVQEAPNGEITIHFRNLKIVLHTQEEIEEWRRGFKEALAKYEDYLIKYKEDVKTKVSSVQ